MSLVFLVLTIGMICLYCSMPYLFVAWIRAGWQKDRAKEQDSGYQPEPFWNKKRRAVLRSMALLVSIACIFIYTGQRIKWMGKDNANLTAKEYYVAGQSLNAFRGALTTFIHPGIPVMAPLRWLQKLIYSTGAKYLPENDGEMGVWQNQWFHHHYSKKGRKELFIQNSKPTESMRMLVNQWWASLEIMATRPFADKQMEEEHYYLDYPSLALSYRLNKGYFAYHYAGSQHSLALIPKHVERARLLSGWLWALQGKWRKSAKTMAFIKKHPKLEAMYLYVLQAELIHYQQGLINQHQFTCDNIAVRRYVAARQQFIKPASGRPAYLRMKSYAQARRLYRWSVDGGQARSMRYVLRHYCGMEVVGKEDNSRYASSAKYHNRTPDQQSEHAAKMNFYDEIKILEEQFNE
jgi:hypothetical protein